MKRWNIVDRGTTLTLYYKDYETAKERNPHAESIAENTDVAYVDFIEKIRAASCETLIDYKGRKVYKVPHNSAYVLVRLYNGTGDDSELFYDYCEYQRHDECRLVKPITWSCSTPEEVCVLFLGNHPIELPVEIISMKQLKTLKPAKFHNRNGMAYFKDGYGYFYFAYKSDLPNKQKKEEHERFKGNKNAVRVKFCTKGYEYRLEWFSSEKDALKEFEKIKSATPTYMTSPTFEIVKRGYTKATPDERRIIFRLPYFDIDKEFEFESGKGIRNGSIERVAARKWCGMLEGYRQFGNAFDNEELLSDIVLRWHVYSEENGGSKIADYYGKSRTNYFKVTDVIKFKDIINNLSGDGEIKFSEHDADKGKFMFFCDGDLTGYVENKDDDDYADDAFEVMIQKLQSILPDGEAIILTEIGNEKMRYLRATALVITNKEVGHVDLNHFSIAKAKGMLGNPDFCTQMDY